MNNLLSNLKIHGIMHTLHNGYVQLVSLNDFYSNGSKSKWSDHLMLIVSKAIHHASSLFEYNPNAHYY